LLLPALLLAALLLLTALCHGVSSPSGLRSRFALPRPLHLGTFPTRDGAKIDHAGHRRTREASFVQGGRRH
jgi:hypothetical protein